MKALLIKAALILTAAETAVMLVLPHFGPSPRWLNSALDPLLMLTFALGPLYLLFKRERARAEKQEILDATLHVIVNDLWSASLHTLSTEALLTRILNEILENSPISLQRKGGIFLVEQGELRLKADMGFDEEQLRLCGSVPEGRCLCGQVLLTGQTVYSPGIEASHHIRPAGMKPHGHYCLPIKSGGDVIGVLTLYLEPGHPREEAEEKFLASVCAIIARIIEGKKMERSLFQMQKMEALNRFAAGIAHDFNNILGAIGGFCSTAAIGVPESSAASGDLKEICGAVERGTELTRQLKLFSRQAKEDTETLDVGQLIKNSSQIISRILGGGIKLELNLAPGPLPVKCSRSQLEQVLLNLSANARDAMPDGGTLTLSCAPCEICFTSTRKCLHAAQITVADTGEGMTEEVREQIFEPFFTTKPEGKGSGLGLAIVHGIVHQHGGEMLLHSSPGAGTRFEIYLPLEAAPSAG